MMKIFFPNSAHLQNFGGFARKFDPRDPDNLEFVMYDKYSSVHPAVLAMAAAAGTYVQVRGGKTTGELHKTTSLRYLVRMKLFDFVDLNPSMKVTEWEPAGRFIPLTQVRDGEDLNRLIVELVPLIHGDPTEAGPIKYVISELVRNVLEHADSPVGALVCAQYYQKTGRLSVGVADHGVGIRESISRSYPVANALDAIHLALRPGITGTTSQVGGDENNAGAGLYILKSIARASRNFFVAYSDNALFKLLKGNGQGAPQLSADPRMDRATREEALPTWPGTVMGMDINVEAHQTFQDLLQQVRKTYDLDIRLKKKAQYKKPRFVK